MNDEQIQKKDRMKELERKVWESMRGRTSHHDGGQDETSTDPGEQKRMEIARNNHFDRLEREEEARVAKEEEKNRHAEEIARRQEEKDEQTFLEATAHMVDADELKERFDEEFPALSAEFQKNPDLFKKMSVALDLELAGSGADPLDFRVYEKIGQEFNERLEKVRENPDAERLYAREDATNLITHENLREIERGNQYFNASFRPDGPVEHEAIQEAFAQDYDDVVNDPKAFKEASAFVDDAIQKDETASDRYPTYQAAGDVARNRNVLRDMAESRGQDPDAV
jgi:hypothetical protein